MWIWSISLMTSDGLPSKVHQTARYGWYIPVQQGTDMGVQSSLTTAIQVNVGSEVAIANAIFKL
ncbi:hypothetical protein MUK42_13888 [Musa troglodytarum]|uniref:Uncharacterized protein n=1 Tax=Musa troglodytarum TaxID=320322 RepID=A0A9E7L0H2_9LILI|nr:hypothetical protein MUK42_13888 [Musa troglodytarum]